jgi:hypothetical protein
MRSIWRSSAALALAAVFALALPRPAAADTIVPVDGSWQSFFWISGPGVFNDGGAFTFHWPGAVKLTVTDAFVVGDRFQVYDFGNLIGTTSQPTLGVPDEPNLDAGLADPNFSHGFFTLPAGSHSLTFKTVEVAPGFPDGGAGFKLQPASVDTRQVPEPTALALACLGGVGLAWRTVRRRKR